MIFSYESRTCGTLPASIILETATQDCTPVQVNGEDVGNYAATEYTTDYLTDVTYSVQADSIEDADTVFLAVDNQLEGYARRHSI